ncbi:MAG: DUF6807 family protein [Bryobacteraceae bacterium]
MVKYSRLAAAFLLISLIEAATVQHADADPVYTLQPAEFGMQLKTPDGRVVFEYMTKKPENVGLTSPSVACFHPVNTPKGERVTALAPNDHPHHRGIFLGWQDSEFHEIPKTVNTSPTSPLRTMNVSRADFWAWGVYAPRDGRVIENRSVKLVGADSKEARIQVVNEWFVGKRKMLDEIDDVTVKEQDGAYILDLDYRLTPIADYILNRSAFGGFDVQCRKDGDSYFSTATGKVQHRDPHYAFPELNWPSEPWYDYSIRLKDTAKTVGAAVIDHLDNPPTTWHNSRTLWMLNPAITAVVPVTIPRDTPLRLRYRVVVHDGDTPTELLQKLSAEWRPQ